MKSQIKLIIVMVLAISLFASCGGGGSLHHTVTYDGNGSDTGSVPTDPTKYAHGKTVTVLDIVVTDPLAKSGYKFVGWNTANDYSGTYYNGGDTFEMDSDNVTLYAQWAAVYSVTYDRNGNDVTGSVPIDPNNYDQGQLVTVLANSGSLSRNGYDFTGWDMMADGSGTPSYDGGYTFSMGSVNVTLYAQWKNYTVKYDCNGCDSGNTIPSDQNTYVEGDTVPVANGYTLTWNGFYNFCSWTTEKGGGGANYSVGDIFLMGTQSVILYAQTEGCGE